jgi:hypothetical protein
VGGVLMDSTQRSGTQPSNRGVVSVRRFQYSTILEDEIFREGNSDYERQASVSEAGRATRYSRK